ncbi:MAG: heavy-metal-associated domain-containing protein [Thermomicrobiales bacterium]
MNARLQEITLTAPDISCGHCVATVQEAVSALDGVERVSADADTKQVAVGFDSTRISLPAIEAAMEEAGYPVAK